MPVHPVCFWGQMYISLMEKVQNEALPTVSSFFKNSSFNAMEIVLGIEPIHLRIKDLNMREWFRIMTLTTSSPLFRLMQSARMKYQGISTPLSFLSNLCHSFYKDLSKGYKKFCYSPFSHYESKTVPYFQYHH